MRWSTGQEHVVVDFVKVLLVTFVALFPVVNPIGDAPIFFALTQRYPQSVREILARKIVAYGFALLAISFLFGSVILAFFGKGLVALQISGGLVLAVTGWSLLNQKTLIPLGTRPLERWRTLWIIRSTH